MHGYKLIVLVAVSAVILLYGCGGERAENPIKPGGEVPELLASLPDGDYFALGYLDFSRLLDSEIGRYLLNRFSLYVGILQAVSSVNLEKDVHKLAFAVRFNEGAYPKLYRALPLILAVRADLEPEQVLTILNIRQFEKYEFEGADLYRYQFQAPSGAYALDGAAFLTFPEPGLVVLSTSREMIEQYLKARGDEGTRIGFGGTMRGLLARVDMRVPGWMAIRHSEESRTLLRMLAGFDDCLISVNAEEALEITCVMDFPSKDDAREMVKRFEFSQRQLKDLISQLDKGDPAMGVWNDATQSFKARQSVDLAIFSASFTMDWFDRMLQPSPAEEREETEEQ